MPDYTIGASDNADWQAPDQDAEDTQGQYQGDSDEPTYAAAGVSDGPSRPVEGGSDWSSNYGQAYTGTSNVSPARSEGGYNGTVPAQGADVSQARPEGGGDYSHQYGGGAPAGTTTRYGQPPPPDPADLPGQMVQLDHLLGQISLSQSDVLQMNRLLQTRSAIQQQINDGTLDPSEAHIPMNLVNAQLQPLQVRQSNVRMLMARQQFLALQHQNAQQQAIQHENQAFQARSLQQRVQAVTNPTTGETLHMFEDRPGHWNPMPWASLDRARNGPQATPGELTQAQYLQQHREIRSEIVKEHRDNQLASGVPNPAPLDDEEIQRRLTLRLRSAGLGPDVHTHFSSPTHGLSEQERGYALRTPPGVMVGPSPAPRQNPQTFPVGPRPQQQPQQRSPGATAPETLMY